MVDVERKLRSRNSLVSSVDKLFDGVVRKAYLEYKEIKDLDSLKGKATFLKIF